MTVRRLVATMVLATMAFTGNATLGHVQPAEAGTRTCPSNIPVAANPEVERALHETYFNEFPELQHFVSLRRFHCIAWCESSKDETVSNKNGNGVFSQLKQYWRNHRRNGKWKEGRVERFNRTLGGKPGHPPVGANILSPWDNIRVSAMMMMETRGTRDWRWSEACWRYS